MSRSVNFADCWECAADRVGDRTALIVGDQRRSYAELEDRANRLANHLAAAGIGPGDHVACFCDNDPAYVEAMLAAYKLRAVPINVNYRYTGSELAYLLADCDAKFVITTTTFAPTVTDVAPELPRLVVGDGYDEALAASPSTRPDPGDRGPDDEYTIYTGGTTGLPKGVVWRMEDAFHACIGGGDPMRLAGPVSSPAEMADRIIDGSFVFFPLAPLMHAAAQWTALSWLFAGGTVVLQPGSLDAAAVWRTVAAERVNVLVVVGDAVGRPLIEAYEPSFDTSSLMTISNGGAPMSPGLRERIASTVPNILLVDGFGSSESGAQGSVRMSADEIKASGGKIAYAVLGDDTQVLDESTLQPVVPGSGQQGRVAKTGHVPLRYHNDPEKSAATFPTLDGRRWVLTGDLATVESDGTITLLGRGSQCINTGGEKVFPEEVEGVLKQHPDVWDAVVVGSPDDRWGQAVTAVVSLAPGHDAPSLEALRDFGRAHLAGYKLPRHLVVVDAVERSPAGKADYPWAQQAAAKALAGGGA